MIQSYIVELENRVNIINSLLGQLPKTYEQQLHSAKDRVDMVTGKILLGKDIQHKYNKLTAFIKKHNDVIDTMLTPDKINVVLDDLDELKQLAESLNNLQKLLPAMDTSDYVKHRPKYERIQLLNTASDVKLNKNTDAIQIVSYDETPLTKLRQQQRYEMSSIIQLNYRMLNNINEKIKLANERKAKK